MVRQDGCKFWNERIVIGGKAAKTFPRTKAATSIMQGKGTFKSRLAKLMNLVAPL